MNIGKDTAYKIVRRPGEYNGVKWKNRYDFYRKFGIDQTAFITMMNAMIKKIWISYDEQATQLYKYIDEHRDECAINVVRYKGLEWSDRTELYAKVARVAPHYYVETETTCGNDECKFVDLIFERHDVEICDVCGYLRTKGEACKNKYCSEHESNTKAEEMNCPECGSKLLSTGDTCSNVNCSYGKWTMPVMKEYKREFGSEV